MKEEKQIINSLDSGIQKAKEISAKRDRVIRMIKANIAEINKTDIKPLTREDILKQIKGE